MINSLFNILSNIITENQINFNHISQMLHHHHLHPLHPSHNIPILPVFHQHIHECKKEYLRKTKALIFFIVDPCRMN